MRSKQYKIAFEVPPLRGIMTVEVVASFWGEAHQMFREERPTAKIREVWCDGVKFTNLISTK